MPIFHYTSNSIPLLLICLFVCLLGFQRLFFLKILEWKIAGFLVGFFFLFFFLMWLDSFSKKKKKHKYVLLLVYWIVAQLCNFEENFPAFLASHFFFSRSTLYKIMVLWNQCFFLPTILFFPLFLTPKMGNFWNFIFLMKIQLNYSYFLEIFPQFFISQN